MPRGFHWLDPIMSSLLCRFRCGPDHTTESNDAQHIARIAAHENDVAGFDFALQSSQLTYTRG